MSRTVKTGAMNHENLHGDVKEYNRACGLGCDANTATCDEDKGSAERPVIVTLYRWAGKKGFFKIKNECGECDITLALLKRIVENDFKGIPIKLEIKPWLNHVGEALLRGGWHAPIVLINKKLFSQGAVPDLSRLKKAIELARPKV